ncbi:MAG: nuclear transport factor 2 family protein [Terriglobales bacterium]
MKIIWAFVLLITLFFAVPYAITQDSLATPKESPSGGLNRSANERAVWQKEETYWNLLKAKNEQKYLELWDDGFVGWPRFEAAPVHKDKITHFMSNRSVLDYKLEPLSVREFGADVVIVIYRAVIHSSDREGKNESTRTSRLLHTWMKSENEWRIIGGMSADDQTSSLSGSSATPKP